MSTVGLVGSMWAQGMTTIVVVLRESARVLTDEYSWNKDLARQRGLHMGQEFRHKGVQVLLGPVVGPIGRVATGGRNWEGFSSDPYLTGKLGAETVDGIQSAGVSASTKVGRETSRFKEGLTDTGSTISATSRSSTATLKPTPKENMSHPSRRILMTQQYMSSTSGRFRMLFGPGVLRSCARMSALITRTAAKTARRLTGFSRMSLASKDT